MRNCFILLFLSIAVFISCNDDATTYSVGDEFVDIDSRTIVTDTLSIITSTILLDSIETSSTSRLLIGALEDSQFGKLTSQTFFNLLAYDYSLDNDATYDSIGIILYYDRYYYGDTTRVQKFRVHEITESFEPYDDGSSFYNTSILEYSDEVLGEVSFIPYPNKKDSIYIPLSYTFGKNIFDNIIDDDVNNDDELYTLFKGLTIIPDTNTNNVVGFGKSSMVMRMYYTIEDENDDDDSEFTKDFSIESSYRVFNKISSDKSGTLLTSLTEQEDILETTDTENFAYIQSGSGLNMRVEMPYMTNFNSLEQDGTTINATLSFYPEIKSHEINEYGADSLSVYIVDSQNRFIQQLVDYDGDAVYAKLNTDSDEFGSNYYFSADVTYFFEKILTSSYELNYALLFQFPNNSSSANKTRIYDSVNADNKMKLTLTYLLY